MMEIAHIRSRLTLIQLDEQPVISMRFL